MSQFQSVDDVIMTSCCYLHETHKPLKRPVGVVLRRGKGRREEVIGEEERKRCGEYLHVNGKLMAGC